MKLLIGILTALLAYHPLANATVDTYFASIKTDPKALYAFLKDMPKGGELHYHLSGGAFAETMLAFAAQDDYCLNTNTFTMTKSSGPCYGISGKELPQHPALYEQTIRAWSLKDFTADQESSHDHFFASFNKFEAVVDDYRPQLLAKIMQRAAHQNELYLEIMTLPDNAKSTTFATNEINLTQFAEVQQQLLNNQDFAANIQHTADESSRILQQTRQHLGCDKNPNQAVCKITIKFQYCILREQALEKIFVQALNGFAAAARSPDIVGVNLVQAEDGPISLRDYHQQMQVFDFLHKNYPQVHIALHAGELAPTLGIDSEHLRFHIHDAMSTGHAERIGHGVDIAFENDNKELLHTMAKNKTAVEINLISNKKILHVTGLQHPLNEYLSHKIPIVLSTDDEGIFRTDLTHQYVEAVLQHGLDYPILKMISRNAITYSFLPGQSLWANAEQALPIARCTNLNSSSCLQFVEKNEKARLQRELENNFIEFEKKFR